MAHEAGALCYYDGANLNAIMGKARPGDMGMDVVHLNLHKTFSTPHGGGGPGAGPVAVSPSARALPARAAGRPLRRHEDLLASTTTARDSIGRVKGFYGNVGVLVRAYTYLLRMGGDGLTRASEDAVLNANYLRARLRGTLPRAVRPGSACTSSCSPPPHDPEHSGAAHDIAKRILDFGMHAPTIYFPLIVPEALMIEPTETEDVHTLDAFVDVMETDRARAAREPGAGARALRTPRRSGGPTRPWPRGTRC